MIANIEAGYNGYTKITWNKLLQANVGDIRVSLQLNHRKYPRVFHNMNFGLHIESGIFIYFFKKFHVSVLCIDVIKYAHVLT